MKKLIIGIITVLLVFTGLGYAVGDYFVNYALSPVSDSGDRNIDEEDKIESEENDQEIITKNQNQERKKGNEFKKTTLSTQILSKDGLKLQANYKTQEKQTHKWVILIHGYKVNNNNMMPYGEKYYENRYYKTNKDAQDAHEAIRPTYSDLEPESLKDVLTKDQYKLYKLIYNRFMASQMASSLYDTVSADIKANDYIFKAI